jgi:4-carboxymuconolactone decarboxylase
MIGEERTMARLKPIALESLTAEQKEIVGDRPSRALAGPHTVWLRRPKLAGMASAMMHYLRRGGLIVPPRLAELVILIAAREFTAQFAWHSHKPQALAAGIDAGVIEAIRDRRVPRFREEDEALIYEFATELIARKAISDVTYQRALAMWGEDFLIDLVNLIGCYMMIAANLVAFQVDTPNGETLLT